MEKILCIDVGNTNTKFALISNDSMDFVGTLQSAKEATFEEWTIQIALLLAHFGSGDETPNGAIISSVVPQITANIAAAVERTFEIKPKLVPTDKGIGADLYCSAAYARAHYPMPVAVFSLGTATTVYVLNENKQFTGGMIIPGMITSLDALSERAANLPQIHPSEPREMLTMSTQGAMNSGIVFGTAAMLDGLAERFAKEKGVKTFVVSGGMSELVCPHTQHKFIVDRDIVLKGAYELYEKEE